MNQGVRLPQWVAEHPISWGVASGSLLVTLALFLTSGEYAVLWIVVGAAFGAANWFIWRPGGPARAWRARIVQRFPPRS